MICFVSCRQTSASPLSNLPSHSLTYHLLFCSFAKETSAYHPIAAEIKQRAALLEKEGIMPVDNVAAAIAKGLAARKAPRYISTGSDVGMYNVLGFMQTWLCPATISNMLQEKFGLKQLHKHLLSRS